MNDNPKCYRYGLFVGDKMVAAGSTFDALMELIRIGQSKADKHGAPCVLKMWNEITYPDWYLLLHPDLDNGGAWGCEIRFPPRNGEREGWTLSGKHQSYWTPKKEAQSA